MKKPASDRFWEVDFLRGIAIIMMVIYHIMFDVVFLNISYIDLSSIPVLLFLYPIGTMFLL
ncbi:MAG TPA: heparan-alpha-glucosaminide N-acetyltransferase domain-containing protein, partial [Candidatus Thermoplasmatota archaeon]|nr:heparan-alpha-glucosaminide N-acetyltransferase domain-containing protein [Candidatus Thermoplasmatota archaeon]